MAVPFPKIGLEAVLIMDAFNRGVSDYIKQVDRMGLASISTKQTMGENFIAMGDSVVKFAEITAAAVAATAIAVGASLVKMALDAAPLKTIEDAFYAVADAATYSVDAMTVSVDTMAISMGNGKQAGTDMLNALQEGSAGMVKDIELMRNFNLAVQLVSDDFGKQLPEAMLYLQKVSASTGYSMDYLLNSLILGVGRLSPRLIDNMGVMVSLEEATDRAAQMFGKEADALSKTEQQAGMMSVVLEKLAENTKNMPDLLGTNYQKWMALKTIWANTSTAIGLKLQPALASILTPLGELAEKYLPMVMSAFETKFLPIIERIAKGIGEFISSLSGGQDFISSFKNAISTMFDTDVADKINGIVDAINNFILKAIEFYSKHSKEIQAAIIAIGATLAVAGIVSIVTKIAAAIASLSNPIGLAIAAAVFLYKAWTENFWGIQEKTKVVVDWLQQNVVPVIESVVKQMTDAFNVIAPVVTEVFAHLEDVWNNITGLFAGDEFSTDVFANGIAEAVYDILDAFNVAQETILPITTAIYDSIMWLVVAFQDASAWISQALIDIGVFVQGALASISGWWAENGENIMSAASKVWTHIINGFALLAAGVKIAIDAIAAWWGEWGGTIMTIAGAVWETVKAIFVAAFEVVESLFLAFIAIINGDWEELGEQLMDIWEAALTFISTLFNTWWSVFKVFVVAALEAVKTFFGNAWQWVLDKVSSVVDGIKALLDPQTWLEVGTNLLNGIVQGVRNAAQGLIDAVVGAARAALDAVKGFLGIQSPSKVAAKKIGLPFAEGIAAGISDGIKTLQAQNWGIDLNNTMAKASMNSGYGNSQQNINKYLNLTVYTSTPAERITTDFRYLEAIG